MAPKKMPWFRMYCEVTGDRKIRSIPLDQRWVWVAVMTLARTSPIPGFLMVSERLACSDEAIADEAAAPLAKTRAALQLMEKLDMIHRDTNLDCWAVTNWDRRQFDSDDVSARTRKHRQRNADQASMERSRNADGTHQSTEAEAETERSNSQQQLESVPSLAPAAAEAISILVAKRCADRRPDGPRYGEAIAAREAAAHWLELNTHAAEGRDARWLAEHVLGMSRDAVIEGAFHTRRTA